MALKVKLCTLKSQGFSKSLTCEGIKLQQDWIHCGQIEHVKGAHLMKSVKENQETDKRGFIWNKSN